MLVCIDVGNSSIHIGLYNKDKFTDLLRLSSKEEISAGQILSKLSSFFENNSLGNNQITAIAVCSVMPSLDNVIRDAVKSYFGKEAYFVDANSKALIDFGKFKKPSEIGADLIAGCSAVTKLFPNQDVIIVDLGTATTFVVMDGKSIFHGGSIMPGIQTQALAMVDNAEKLNNFKITEFGKCLGTDTESAMKSGIYYGHLGAMREIIANLNRESFGDKKAKVIATGGYSSLFINEGVFDEIISDLVLLGIANIYNINKLNS